MQSIVEKLHDYALSQPESLAAAFENDEMTYAELWDSVLRCYDVLRRAGVQNGDRVVFQTCYTRIYLIACYAVHLCHATFVPIDKISTPNIIETIRQRMDARCLITKEKVTGAQICLTFSELSEQLASASASPEYTFPDDEDAACILSTTGTTGDPKGAILSQRSLSAYSIAEAVYADFTPETVNLSFVPLNHVAPMWTMFALTYCGGASVILDGIMRLKLMYEYIEKYNVSSLYIPPSGLSILAQNSSNKLANYADQIKFFVISSASMSDVQREYITRTLPNTFISFGYGSSEMGWVSGLKIRADDVKPVNCVGRPIPGVTVRIVDDDKNDVPVGQPGQIMVKSDLNFSGYWQNPALTEKMMYNGFVVADDICYMDEEGLLYIVGRKDDMINIGGLKVFPAEIENAAMSIDGVLDCICFRAQDPITGQAAKLLIVKKEDSALTLQEIRTQLLKSLDAYKIPRMIDFTDHIEKTANGKPNRKAYQ